MAAMFILFGFDVEAEIGLLYKLLRMSTDSRGRCVCVCVDKMERLVGGGGVQDEM
jgi:hypothetical protein